MDLYKKIDKSMFRYGTTIPKAYVNSFFHSMPLKPGDSREVTLHWLKKKLDFQARLVHVDRTKAASVYQLRWDNNYRLLLELKKEFIQSYLAIQSENFPSIDKGVRYMTNLKGGNQEVLIIKPIDLTSINLETFIQVSTPYDEIFRRLVEENVFGWLSQTSRDYLITKSTQWLDASELNKHLEVQYVIYYLIDEKSEEIYIGSAERLGDRVKLGRPEIPSWNKFRYEIIHPEYHHLFRRVESLLIGSFANFFNNRGNIHNMPVSKYTLVNKNWGKAR
jgi:hypothetical protein